MPDKHKRAITEPLEADDLKITLNILSQSIMALGPKQQHLLNEWLETWSKYMAFERNFDPTRLMHYKRGDIVLIELGYNVGSEYGGKRYAVVVEKNPSARPVITVIPITTLEKGRTKESLHESEIYLGEIIPGAESYAIPLHMRTISKLRIIKPKTPPPLKRLSPEQLNEIDGVIMKYFTK